MWYIYIYPARNDNLKNSVTNLTIMELPTNVISLPHIRHGLEILFYRLHLSFESFHSILEQVKQQPAHEEFAVPA
jgi:hypothetical protein